jgi:hypothetical protein
MNLEALQHLLRSATALAEDCEILILGSASLLASFPELGHPDAPLASTYDADICPQPYDEITAVMLDEALGGKSRLLSAARIPCRRFARLDL